ncbi:iron-sulfur cluster carrier protein MrpORP [Thermodesulfobacteriota bacterium]
MNTACSSSKEQDREEQDRTIQETLGRVRNKILVMSGKGGVGKSSIAVNLAAALAKRSFNVGLMDVDLHGPSVPGLLGMAAKKAIMAGERIRPVPYNDNLYVISIENLLDLNDQAVIWRGPLKISAIRQFIAEVHWGILDYLVIDSPPGTGDEPLTVAQTVVGAQALIVTTPQEISLADVRKSINFCRSVDLPVLGLVENMSGFDCPDCGARTDLFGSGGGERTAKEMGIPFLGKIPIEAGIVAAGDKGSPYLVEETSTPAAAAFQEIVAEVVKVFENGEVKEKVPEPQEAVGTPEKKEKENGRMKIAIPTAQGKLCAHFGHCETFAMVAVEGDEIKGTVHLTPPPHEPGVLPRWLHEQGADMIIAGGMGSRAQGFFRDYGVEVVVGAPDLPPEEVVKQYLDKSLQMGANICDH